MTKMPKGTSPPRRGKRCNDADAQSCRTRKRASYIHRCLNVRKLQKCGELRKMENYCLYVNLKEMLKESYCKGNASNTNGNCLKVTTPPPGEVNEGGERNHHDRCCKCASHTFHNCYVTGLHIFEGIFLTACSGGIMSIFDKNLNNILSRRVATSPISNISVSKKENALCFSDSYNHLYVVHLNGKNLCKGNHFNIRKRDSHLDESAVCASTPYQHDDKIMNSFDEEEGHTFLNDKQYAHLTKKEKAIVQAFLHNNISCYNVKNLNCCVINPYFDHHQSNSICVLTSNKIVSVLNIFEFHINNSVLFRGHNILSLHWHSVYVFICTGVSIFVVNFFEKTKIAHIVLANLDIIEKVNLGQAGHLSGEKNVKADVPVNHNDVETNTCSDKMDGVTNEPQMICSMESIHICELQKGEYAIARGENVKIVKIEKKNGIEKISISNEFDVHNSIISIRPYYDHQQNGFPENEVFLSVITVMGDALCQGVNQGRSTYVEHMILTRDNYLMCRNYLYTGGVEKDTIRRKYLTNTSCTSYPGGDANCGESTTGGKNTNKKLPLGETSCDREDNAHLIGNPDEDIPQRTLFQYMKNTPNWGQRNRSGAIERCLYIYGKNTLLQFRSKTVAEFFSEIIRKSAKNGRNIFPLLDALKRQPICKKELTQIGLSLINAFIKRRNYFIAANVFILLCNHFCDKYRVIYNVMEMFFLRKHMHILSLFYRKLKEERTHQMGSGLSSSHAISDKRRRFIIRSTMGKEKKIKSALYILHLYYLKRGRKKKKTKRDKKRHKCECNRKKKRKKKNFLFFATKKLFNQFLVFLLRADVYEFRKVYEISSNDDLDAGVLVKHIVHFLEGDLSSPLKKQFIRSDCGGNRFIDCCNGTLRGGRSTIIGTAKWADRPHGSNNSSENCNRGGHRRSNCMSHHYTDRSRRNNTHGDALKEEKKKNADKGILLDILLDIFFKFDIPLGDAPFALLCKDREEEQKKKKNEPYWNSNNGEEVTSNDKTATTGGEDKLVKKNDLPVACLQGTNIGCTSRGKIISSNRYKEKSACTKGEDKLANEERLHRNEHRSEGRLIPIWEELLSPLPHQRDENNEEGDQRKDEKENTYLRMEFRKDHADWDGDNNRCRDSNGTDEEEKRMKRRSRGRGKEPNRLSKHNKNGTNTTNTVKLSKLTNDYFSCGTHRRSAPLTFEDLAKDCSPQNLSFFEKEFDNVKKMEIIKMLIRRKNKKVFAYLKQCSWQVLKKITQKFVLKLFRLSRIKTAKLLVIVKVKEKNKYRYFFNPKDVMRRLKERPFFLYTYLKRVKNVKYLSRYIHLFLFLMFIFEPLLLVRFLARHYKCVSFKRVLFFVCFFDRLHGGGELTTEKVTPVDDVKNEEVTHVNEVMTNEEVTPTEEAPPGTRPPKSKNSLFQNERVMLLYRYLLDEQVEKEKLEELFSYTKQSSTKRPQGANFFLSVKAFMYVKFGYINKALTIYKQLSNYDEVIYLVKVHKLLIDDSVMKKAEDNLASLNGAPFLSGVDNKGLLRGRHVGIASAGGTERRFRLKRGKKKTNKQEEDAHSVLEPNGGDDPGEVGLIHSAKKSPRQMESDGRRNSHYGINAIDTYVRRNVDFPNLDREIMLSLYSQVEGKGRRKGDAPRKGKRKSNQRDDHRSNSGGSSPSLTHKESILRKHLIDNTSREMHYLTLMCILRELFYLSELSDNYNRILKRCKENTYSRFNEVKKRGYVIYNGIIKKEMKNNNLYFLDINDYYFISDKVEHKRSNELDMIMPHMDEHRGLLERSGMDKEEQELPLNIQRGVPPNYYFYEQIHDKPYVSLFSSFCSSCQHNIYRDLCVSDGGRKSRGDGVVFFFCNHLYHLKCLRGRPFICLACH
ncbi:Uncharacterized protein PCOAH_00017530 [Plasmodium coatneyi]|uniref:Uncharacterized protein n=1 Tax=Plasmodium coatneyi TaxID=208452 RepID=A0A1B1DXG6_9APIC|nr:Uncharacterized protein PCOAH_00017530 [Plasmodium coatneyi]ANQ07319.1 Uncharacterized protein PCOAH_00017530 [Plasmodium coatneyi]